MLDPRMKLRFNPFDPAASGPPIDGAIAPDAFVEALLTAQAQASPVTVISGPEGSGKTTLLEWIATALLPDHGILAFHLRDRPVGVYELADQWIASVGQTPLARTLWEFTRSTAAARGTPFPAMSYPAYAESAKRRPNSEPTRRLLQDLFLDPEITDDPDIAECLARLVAEYPWLERYRYADLLRNLLRKARGAATCERKEPELLRALLGAYRAAHAATALALLIDEPADRARFKTGARRDERQSAAMLGRLHDLSRATPAPLRLFLAMRPETLKAARESASPKVAALLAGAPHVDLAKTPTPDRHLLRSRLLQAYEDPLATTDLHPFRSTADLSAAGRPAHPRTLVQIASLAISSATRETAVPFTKAYLQEIADRLYIGSPAGEASEPAPAPPPRRGSPTPTPRHVPLQRRRSPRRAWPRHRRTTHPGPPSGAPPRDS